MRQTLLSQKKKNKIHIYIINIVIPQNSREFLWLLAAGESRI